MPTSETPLAAAMKKRLLVIPAAIAIATVVCLIQRSHLQQVRAETARVEQSLAARKSTVEPSSSSSSSPTTTDGGVVREYKTLVRSLYAISAKGSSPEKEERMLALLKQIDPATLAEFLKELGRDPEFRNRAEVVLRNYLDVNPRAAMEIALGMPDQVSQFSNRSGFGFLFYQWTRKEPAAAMAWLKAEDARIPQEIRSAMLGDACANLVYADPRATLTSILGDGRADGGEMGKSIGEALVDPSAIRAFFKAANDLEADPAQDADRLAAIREGVAGTLAPLFLYQSFSTATGLINECLTADEKITLANYCNQNGGITESVKWADWLMTFEPSQQDAASAPPHPLVTRMASWAKEDTNSARAWLQRMPEGPLKEQATAACEEGARQRAAGKVSSR